MNYGYVKVAAAVPRVKVADCKFNASEIEKEIIIADGKGVQIIAFPELCITGYTCGDLFAQQLLLEEAEMGLIQILNNTRQMDIISILGMPVALNGVLLNAAVVIQKGRVLGVVPRLIFPIIRSFMRSAGLLPHVMWQKTVCAFAADYSDGERPAVRNGRYHFRSGDMRRFVGTHTAQFHAGTARCGNLVQSFGRQ